MENLWVEHKMLVVKLKDPHLFPHKKQYLPKPEVKKGLKPIVKNLKEQGLFPVTAHAFCLGINQSNGKWSLVQDL